MEDEEKTQYPRLKRAVEGFIENEDSFLSEYVLEKIAWAALRDERHSEHEGINTNRLANNPREQAFHDVWLEENDPSPGINHGHGILQDLFINHEDPFKPLSPKRMEIEINKRDRIIVATVIQWLGSNVGMSFLHTALDKCGYKITEKR